MALHALLLTLLVTAQAGVRVHADEHNSGMPQETSCASCIIASQLGSVCVDNSLTEDFRPVGSCVQTESHLLCKSIHTLSARQRGPPESF